MAFLSTPLVLLGAVLMGPGSTSADVASPCALRQAPGQVQSHTVGSGDRLASILRSHGLRAEEAARLQHALRKEHNLNRLSIGDRIDLVGKSDGAVLWFRYRRNLGQAVCARRDLRESYVVRAGPLAAQTKLARVAITIDGKVKDALQQAGESASLAVMLQDLFIGGLNRRAEQGPSQLTLLVERRTIEGDLLDYGRIFAAERTQGDKTTQTFHFVAASGAAGYYDADGEARRSTKLRSPVPSAVLTSGFGLRRHPIKRRRRMHKGIDYGAPHGTPVQAAADGTILFARRKGHLGKTVGIRHEDGLITHYAHLSSFATHSRSGRSVSQGQVIGYVGSTGLSSGAHLHFETLVNRRHIDPAKLLSAPAPALNEADKAEFLGHVQELLQLLHPDGASDQDA